MGFPTCIREGLPALMTIPLSITTRVQNVLPIEVLGLARTTEYSCLISALTPLLDLCCREPIFEMTMHSNGLSSSQRCTSYDHTRIRIRQSLQEKNLQRLASDQRDIRSDLTIIVMACTASKLLSRNCRSMKRLLALRNHFHHRRLRGVLACSGSTCENSPCIYLTWSRVNDPIAQTMLRAAYQPRSSCGLTGYCRLKRSRNASSS